MLADDCGMMNGVTFLSFGEDIFKDVRLALSGAVTPETIDGLIAYLEDPRVIPDEQHRRLVDIVFIKELVRISRENQTDMTEKFFISIGEIFYYLETPEDAEGKDIPEMTRNLGIPVFDACIQFLAFAWWDRRHKYQRYIPHISQHWQRIDLPPFIQSPTKHLRPRTDGFPELVPLRHLEVKPLENDYHREALEWLFATDVSGDAFLSSIKRQASEWFAGEKRYFNQPLSLKQFDALVNIWEQE